MSRAGGFPGPLLIAHGDKDQFASLPQIGDYIRGLKENEQTSESLTVIKIDNCDHFFGDRQEDLAKSVCEWICSTSF